MLIAQLVQRGEVAVAGRQNRERICDLADHVYPLPPLADHEAGELLVHAVHDDEMFHDDLRPAVEFRITELARRLDLTVSQAPHET